MDWRVVKCDDGTWMVCNDGDILCFGVNQISDEENKKRLEKIAKVMNAFGYFEIDMAEACKD